MLQMTVLLDGTGALDGHPPEKTIHVRETIVVAALDNGMESGKPSIAFIITLPDGQKVLAETSMSLFHLAAKIFAARFGWQDER